MKTYVVTYIHSTESEVYDSVDVFLDMESAAKKYEEKRRLAVETARDDDPDCDEEIFRDMSISETRYHFRCHVRDYNENFVVRLAVKDAL